MDDVDKKILNVLQTNSRTSYHKLAKMFKMAANTVHNRVKNMEKKGYIKTYSAILDMEKIGFNSSAVIGLTVEPLKMKEIARKIALYNNVQLVAITSGDHDLILQAYAEDEKALWRFINEKIKPIDGVLSHMDVSSFLEVYKNTHLILFKSIEKKSHVK
jgi:Lrp/AsnC family transcriptional regulator for asnA, asnC and gidA